jgi:hypothetical protein
MRHVVSDTLPSMERDDGKFHANIFPYNSIEYSLFLFFRGRLELLFSRNLENIYYIFPLSRTCFAPGGIIYVTCSLLKITDGPELG